MIQIQLVIPGEPQGKARTRSFINYKTGRVINTTPTKTRNMEAMIKAMFAQSYPGFTPVEGPVFVTILAYLGIPVSASGRKRAAMLMQEMLPTRRPDLDNIVKLVADALNGLAFRDDKQIVKVSCSKLYSDRPRLEVMVSWEGVP